MSRIRLPKALLYVALVIPTQGMDGWRTENFSRIEGNEVSATSKGVLVHVRQSASPLIYPLKSAQKVSGFKVSGEFRGLPKFSDISLQGEKGLDDYALRLGFVVPGEKRLSGIKKMFASQWVKHLYNQAPPGSGIDHVHFFDITQNPSQLGKARTHPASDLVQEEFIGLVEKPGPFSYSYTFKAPIEAVAIWISIDGDDTKSEFEVLISNLELMTN